VCFAHRSHLFQKTEFGLASCRFKDKVYYITNQNILNAFQVSRFATFRQQYSVGPDRTR